METRFQFGEQVRVTRTVRNDGTFPGVPTGGMLVRAGSIGFVRNVGTFLQDQVIYTVHFVNEDRMVGCRDAELVDVDSPWVPAKFEFRDRVKMLVPLGIQNQIVAAVGDEGEITKVLRECPGGPAYHVFVNGRTFQIPETALAEVECETVGATS